MCKSSLTHPNKEAAMSVGQVSTWQMRVAAHYDSPQSLSREGGACRTLTVEVQIGYIHPDPRRLDQRDDKKKTSLGGWLVLRQPTSGGLPCISVGARRAGGKRP
jgi:hypothetical protein